MSTFVSLPTRFGGSLNISVSDAASLAVRSANGMSGTTSLTKIWDRIKDWFLGTHFVEAKEHLAQLYAAGVADEDRLASFQELKKLAGPAFQDRFSIVPQDFGYAIEIDYGSGLPAYHHEITVCSERYLELKWNQVAGEALDPGKSEEDRTRILREHETQLMNDLSRLTYVIDSEPLDFSPPVGAEPNDARLMLQTFRAVLLSGGTLTSQQHVAVEALAAQGIFADVGFSAQDINWGKLSIEAIAAGLIGPELQQTLNISRSGDDIILQGISIKEAVDLTRTNFKRSPLMLSRVVDFSLSIDPAGRVKVISASYCGPERE